MLPNRTRLFAACRDAYFIVNRSAPMTALERPSAGLPPPATRGPLGVCRCAGSGGTYFLAPVASRCLSSRPRWIGCDSPKISSQSTTPLAETAMPRDDNGNGGGRPSTPHNVLGERLEVCSVSPITGFFRDGCCDTRREDIGSHTVCVSRVFQIPWQRSFDTDAGIRLSRPYTLQSNIVCFRARMVIAPRHMLANRPPPSVAVSNLHKFRAARDVSR
jgi:Uncharacterized protein conserved in bacteria (DUF2237)